MKNYVLVLFTMFLLHNICAQNKLSITRIDFHFLPWSVEGLGTRLDTDEIKSDKYYHYFSLKDSVEIKTFINCMDSSNLTPTEVHQLDARMIIELYSENNLSASYFVGKAVKLYYKVFDKNNIKPPFFVYNNMVYIGLLNIQMNNDIYRANFSLTNFLLKTLPLYNNKLKLLTVKQTKKL